MGRHSQTGGQTDWQADGQLDRGAPCSYDGSIVISRRTDGRGVSTPAWAFVYGPSTPCFICIRLFVFALKSRQQPTGLGLGFGFVKLAKICSTIDSLQ